MKKQANRFLDFEVDKLTNSIENVLSGDSFQTEISVISKEDLNLISKKSGWLLIGKRRLKHQIGMFIN